MATSFQTLPLTRGQNKNFRNPPPASSRCMMGSVGSLVERPDASPPKGSRAVPQVRPQQSNGLLKKSFTQRELLNYLNITRKEPKASGGKKDAFSGHEENRLYAKVYHKDGTEVDLTKNSLPSEKARSRSAFKPVTPKNFSSMQNLYPSSKWEEAELGLSDGLLRAYAHVPKAISTFSSSSSRHGAPASSGHKAVSSPRGASHEDDHEDDHLSDSGHNSMSSLPPDRPPFRPHLSHISASMGQINTIGSADRTRGPGGVAIGEMACRSMATLSRLAPYGGEAPPPYEWTLSLSVEEVVRDLEERLVEKEHELKQMRRNLDESEGAIAQVFEGKQRLWEKEVEELKRLYAAKLRQVTQHAQHAQRSQRGLQLQLFKAQQEKSRLQEAGRSEEGGAMGKRTGPTLEETQWEVCQRSGEISLRDARAETRRRGSSQAEGGAEESCSGGGGPTEERLRAELLLERRQSEAQAAAFEEERQTWQAEKEKVIRYQKELQAGYLETFHRSEALERELQQLRAAGGGGGGGGGGAGSRNGTLETEVAALRSGEFSGLPWIDRIESSEI
ncbi:NEDD4-binding protein 3-A isoform X2 [Pseudoliparis swirei]|uniref:NEDD4-binding protein 3-A isoform X2 n=1 Tax=Pseudoliparis swirei TaxID=2059687 RepID=UPI0024BD8AF8|nr:NEDD4-binding protein 3-A isoform X2 [Pseudoliparis swirei]